MENEIKSDFIVDKETAQADVERWLKANRIRIDRPFLDQNESRDIQEDIQVITQEIMEGRIEINDKNQLIFRPEDNDPLTFYRPRASDLKVLDRKKKHAEIEQIMALLSVITRTTEQTISKLYTNDQVLAASIGSLFLVK